MNTGEFRTTGAMVSVLMSTYNRPQYVKEALASIFSQVYQDFEVVLVRDGGCRIDEAVRPFADDPRLIFIDRDRNFGLPRSFNQALEIAHGDYIAYLGDDDMFFPHHLSVLVDAIEKNSQYGAVYTDLYKVHCRVEPSGKRTVLSKNVEISRDFDRMAMFQFNHVLHVSVLHRKDIFEKAGRYNESLNILIDWDLNRKLCFYTDFLHVPVISGQYYAPVGDCDRISVQRRKNVDDYLRNLYTIRGTRPVKPWPKVKDLSVIILSEKADKWLLDFVSRVHTNGFYPYKLYVPLDKSELFKLPGDVLNMTAVSTDANADIERKLDTALEQVEGELVCVVENGLKIDRNESMWVERSLCPLLESDDPLEAFELVDSTEGAFAAVFTKEQLVRARRNSGQFPLKQSLADSGIKMRKPKIDEYPFNMDNIMMSAIEFEKNGQWLEAAKVMKYLFDNFGNRYWFMTRMANDLFMAGKYKDAVEAGRFVNSKRPAVSSLLIEARALKECGLFDEASEVYERAGGYLDYNPARELLIRL